MEDGISIGKAYVQIIPTMRGVTENISKVMQGQEVEAIGKNSGNKMSKGMKAALVAGSALAVASIAKKISNSAGQWIEAYNIQNEAETKLTEVMQTRMGATEKQIQGVKDYASELQKLGVVGDEVALSGSQQLATFLKTDDALKSLMPAMANLAVQQNGVNVSSENMTSIANMMGKALQGQVSALTRVGITMDENQKKLLKQGTEQERAALLADIITQNVGNMNEKIASTDSGKIQQYKNNLGDIQETLGKKVLPVQVKFYGLLNGLGTVLAERVIPFIEKHSGQLKTLTIFVGSLVTVIGAYNAIMAIKAAVDASGAVTLGAYAVAQAAALAPILAVAAALTAAIVVGIKVYKNWDKLKTGAKELAGTVKDKFTSLGKKIVYPFEWGYNKIKGFFDKIKAFFPLRIGNILSGLKLPHFSVNPDGWKLTDLLKGKLPSIGVEWYAKGGIMTDPTVFGFNGSNLMVGGEAGAEAIVPLNELWKRLESNKGGTATIIINLDGKTIGETAVEYINGQTIIFNQSPLIV